jgi:hypothetical protein
MLPSEGSGPVGPDGLDAVRRELRMFLRPLHPAVGPLASALDRCHPPLPLDEAERFLDAAHAVVVGSAPTPYLWRIMMGDNRASARADSTATAQFLGLVRILGADVPGYDSIVKPEKFNVEDDIV